jgi:hypothetical protein
LELRRKLRRERLAGLDRGHEFIEPRLRARNGVGAG